MVQNIVGAVVSGIVAALASWLPVSPEGGFGRLVDGWIGYTTFLVPAYAGLMFSVLYRYRGRLSRDPLMAIRGVQTSELQYAVFGFLWTFLLGIPLAGLSGGGNSALDVFNLVLALLITFFGLTWPRLTLLKDAEGRIPSRPSFLDAVLAGLFQGVSSSGEASRTGLVTFALLLTGNRAEDVLEWGFLIAPAYHLIRLLYLGTYQGSILLGLISAATAFFVSLEVMELLVKCAKHFGTKKFLTLFGLIGVLLNLGVLV